MASRRPKAGFHKIPWGEVVGCCCCVCKYSARLLFVYLCFGVQFLGRWPLSSYFVTRDFRNLSISVWLSRYIFCYWRVGLRWLGRCLWESEVGMLILGLQFKRNLSIMVRTFSRYLSSTNHRLNYNLAFSPIHSSTSFIATLALP